MNRALFGALNNEPGDTSGAEEAPLTHTRTHAYHAVSSSDTQPAIRAHAARQIVQKNKNNHRSSHSLVDMGAVRLHLLDGRGELVQQLLVRVQGEQVFLPEQEAEAVAFRPAQAVARRRCHRGDGVLDVNHGVELT